MIVFISLVYCAKVLTASRRVATTGWDHVVAEVYASELLELFRAMPTADLLAYLQTNPADDTLPPYYFCADINLLDRATGARLNPDPVATLDTTPLDWAETANLKPNRFYRVNIINIKTLAINTARCVADARSEGVPASAFVWMTGGFRSSPRSIPMAATR